MEDSVDWSMSSTEEEVTLTAQEVLALVEKAWQNEKLCMELLCPLVEETDCMQQQLKILDENFRILSKRDIRYTIHKMEGERIRYILASYFRTRLNKIQTFPWFIKKQEETRAPGKPSRLTDQEKVFLEQYIDNMEAHLMLMGTNHMPPVAQDVPENALQFKPNIDSFVFFQCHQAADVITTDENGDEEEVSLVDSARYIMRYRAVQNLMHEDKIQLF